MGAQRLFHAMNQMHRHLGNTHGVNNLIAPPYPNEAGQELAPQNFFATQTYVFN